MKTKRFILCTSIILALSATAAFIFHSCSKDDILVNNEINSDILTFKSFDDYCETLNKVISFSAEEREAWEKSRGFKSFGRTCDEIYATINPETFSSVDEIKSFVAEKSEYLKFVEDETGKFSVETILSRIPERYIINQEKMFKVNSQIFKILENTILIANERDVNELTSINETNLNYFKDKTGIGILKMSNNDMSFKLDPPGCGYHRHAIEDNGKNRTVLYVDCYEYFGYDPYGSPLTWAKVYTKIEPRFRFLGGWFSCTRTISCDVRVAARSQYWENNQWVWKTDKYRHQYLSSSPISSHEHYFRNEIVGGGHINWTGLYPDGIDAWGDTPSTPPAEIECNVSACY